MTEAQLLDAKPRRGLQHAAASLIAALCLIALGGLAAPVLRAEVAHLWPAWRRSTTGGSHHTASQQPTAVVRSLVEWQEEPGIAFLTAQSQCVVQPDGSVTLGPPPAGLPFLFDLRPDVLPSKKEACSHCESKGCNSTAPLLEKTCCGVCQFDGRFCYKQYPGDARSEAAAEAYMEQGHPLQYFLPCELFQRIRGRTLWFVGDSQTWHWYYALECFLREFAPSLRRTDPVPAAQLHKLSTSRQMYCKQWWQVPPECLELVHGTRVCIVRADLASEMVESVLPTLQQHVPGFERDILVYNTGLHYFEFDGKCNATTCDVPGPDSKYVRELAELADYLDANRHSLPSMVWVDTSPQHFPNTGYYAGDFHAEDCEPWEAWERGEAVPRAGGMWNMAAAPFVSRLGDAHLRTWDATIPLWAVHMPKECTHFCQPSAYHIWLYMLNNLMRDSQLGSPVNVHSLQPEGQLLAGAQPAPQ